MATTVDSKRWWIGHGPARYRWQARWNAWLMAHDPERQARIATAREEAMRTGSRDAFRRWLDVD